jgi:FMN phosphatase YigB (HAD superfamily)
LTAACEAAPVGAVVVDVPDVIYDATLWRRWLLRLVWGMGFSGDPVGFLRDWDANYLVEVQSGHREPTEALQSFLLAWGFSWAQVDEIEAASRVQRQSLEHNPRALPGVVKTLTRLSEWGLPLLAWSDAPHTAAKTSELLDRLGLSGQFQAVLSSLEIEHTQPAGECYAAMLDQLAVPARDVVYVGHERAHLAAAQAAGMSTVAFNFREPTTADVHLNRFEDLLTLLHPSNRLPPAPLASHGQTGRAAFEPVLSREPHA